MDSVSGSLLDSEPCSPVSPASPDHNIPFKPTSPITISKAISSYAASRGRVYDGLNKCVNLFLTFFLCFFQINNKLSECVNLFITWDYVSFK